MAVIVTVAAVVEDMVVHDMKTVGAEGAMVTKRDLIVVMVVARVAAVVAMVVEMEDMVGVGVVVVEMEDMVVVEMEGMVVETEVVVMVEGILNPIGGSKSIIV